VGNCGQHDIKFGTISYTYPHKDKNIMDQYLSRIILFYFFEFAIAILWGNCSILTRKSKMSWIITRVSLAESLLCSYFTAPSVCVPWPNWVKLSLNHGWFCTLTVPVPVKNGTVSGFVWKWAPFLDHTVTGRQVGTPSLTKWHRGQRNWNLDPVVLESFLGF
jgi:hypothetical protein